MNSRWIAFGLCLLLIASVHGQSDTETVPLIGSRTADGFVVRCYWMGSFTTTEKAEGQGVVGSFGQALSPLNFTKTTTASVMITEEFDDKGQPRAVVRGGNWECKVTHLNYWMKTGERIPAGPDAARTGSIPLTGPGAPSVQIDHGPPPGTVGIHLSWSGVDAETLAFDVSYNELAFTGPRGLDVKLGGTVKTERWHADVMGMTATEEPVQPDRTVFRQEWGDPGSNYYARWNMTRLCAYGELRLITPRGDPRTAPRNSGNGQNEFTFDDVSPGKLVVNFKASITPASAAYSVRDRVSFSIDPIGASAMEWALPGNPNGKATFDGHFFVAKATFKGLPTKNDDFGKKRVQLLLDGALQAATYIEVFFKRDATNHPGGQTNSPNWFHYWSQLAPGHKLKYGGRGNRLAAEVKAATLWTYATAVDKKEITIYDATKGKYKSYSVGEEFSGIDRLLGTIKHEARHVDQIVHADQLVPTNGSDSFRFGWSWRTPHNHWSKGPDGKWGAAGVDDDHNGNADDAKVAPPFEPGTGDDLNLAHPSWWFWPNVWPIPVPNRAPSPMESDAVNYSDKNHNEHQNARDDWSDPGKNHQTLNRYDD